MKTKWEKIQPPLTDGELAQMNLSHYSHYPGMLFINVIVHRGPFWHIALLQFQEGKMLHSSVHSSGFRLEEEARIACEQEHSRMQLLFKLALRGFDIQSLWFK